MHELGHLPLEARVHGRQVFVVHLEERLAGRRSSRIPGVVEIEALRHAVVPLKRVVYVVEIVGARVERREHLAVGESVPLESIALDGRLDLEPVDVRVQHLVREDVAPLVTTALLVVAAHVLGVARAVGEGHVSVIVRPGELGDLLRQHRKLPQSLNRGVHGPEHRVQRRTRLLEGEGGEFVGWNGVGRGGVGRIEVGRSGVGWRKIGPGV